MAELTRCPEYANEDGSLRCGLQLQFIEKSSQRNWDEAVGPLEHVEYAKIRCLGGHTLFATVEALQYPDGQ